MLARELSPCPIVAPVRALFSGLLSRQDSNPYLPVLETGALPIELRPIVREPLWRAAVCMPRFRLSLRDSGRTRTYGQRIKSPLLYQLSYRTASCESRARTGDLRVMSPARYQLRYPAMALCRGFEPQLPGPGPGVLPIAPTETGRGAGRGLEPLEANHTHTARSGTHRSAPLPC